MTNVLSPTRNWDQTALNLRALMGEAGLRESACVFWNAVPWCLDRRRDPDDAELRAGAAYLRQFLALVPTSRAVVALGKVAQRACLIAGVESINVPSASPLAVARPGARLTKKAERWQEIVVGLREAARLASAGRHAMLDGVRVRRETS